MVSMSSSIRSSLRRDQLHVCSIFELVARLCARMDVIFVYVMQIRKKSGCSTVCIITFATCSDIMSDQLKIWSAMARSKVNNDYGVMTIMLFLVHRQALHGVYI